MSLSMSIFSLSLYFTCSLYHAHFSNVSVTRQSLLSHSYFLFLPSPVSALLGFSSPCACSPIFFYFSSSHSYLFLVSPLYDNFSLCLHYSPAALPICPWCLHFSECSSTMVNDIACSSEQYDTEAYVLSAPAAFFILSFKDIFLILSEFESAVEKSNIALSQRFSTSVCCGILVCRKNFKNVQYLFQSEELNSFSLGCQIK